MTPISRRGLLAGAAALAATGGAAAATLPPDERRYEVSHELYGSIGTYVNSIRPGGGLVEVETRLHLLVRMFGVSLHREEARRLERWSGGRLLAFRGLTTTNGETVEVTGEARPDGFLVTTPTGSVLAPADIRPTNPWAGSLLKSGPLLQTDNGAVEQARLTGPAPASVEVGGVMVEARRYEIEAAQSYRIWIDSRDVPLKFSVEDESGEVTFLLSAAGTPGAGR